MAAGQAELGTADMVPGVRTPVYTLHRLLVETVSVPGQDQVSGTGYLSIRVLWLFLARLLSLGIPVSRHYRPLIDHTRPSLPGSRGRGAGRGWGRGSHARNLRK